MRVRDMEIGEVQERFANLVWDHEPIPSGQLVKLCEQELEKAYHLYGAAEAVRKGAVPE